ncbi:MAG TPA: LssY C-terminal domain-containing protein [Bryobacteraceae bacterium]|nr:LssY C-terminal domain-containing protein [Bryobacteraceae bacterium]
MRLGIAWLLFVAAASSGEIPTGTRIEIRLTSAVNSAKAKVDDKFDAIIIAPVVAQDQIAISAGVKLKGHIQEVKAVVNPDDQAVLGLAFDEISDTNGKRANLAARVAGVDNARESVDKDGRILGIIASQTGSGRLDQGINKVSEKYSGLGELLGTIKQAVMKEPDANIDYEAGVEINIELTKPLTWTGSASAPNVRPVEPEGELTDLVNRLPFRTSAAKPPKESDVTNILFLGSRQNLEDAFQAAGWSTAKQLNAMSKFETFRAMSEQRGYKEAPMSVLLWNGRPPDLVFQKQNDTFNARHHLRIWQVSDQFRGRDVWVCSATHDTGIDFSEENRTFIHKIDGQIDRERAKVVNDLLFTRLVTALSLVDRPGVAVSFFNATGDKVTTDGRMAVIGF